MSRERVYLMSSCSAPLLTLHDVAGRRIADRRVQMDTSEEAEIRFTHDKHGVRLRAGVYWLRVLAGVRVETRRVVLLEGED